MKNPKISLVLIYNNCYDKIEECLKSVINQSFSDIEIICVNNGSTDNSEDVVKRYYLEDSRIKLISLPIINDNIAAQKTGLGLASGDFVCFITAPQIIEVDFVKELYIKTTSLNTINIEENHLYRRTFIENDKEISQLIEEKINSALEKSLLEVENRKNELQNEYNNFVKTNIETINNANYEVVQRFNQLEKLFYEKDYEYKKLIQEHTDNLYNNIESRIKQIYDDIDKVYNYINSEINLKGAEINKVYEEITKNYHYTEQLLQNKQEEFSNIANRSNQEIINKQNELEREIIVRYVNLKRLLDMFVDETDSKIKALVPSDLSYFKNAVDITSLEKTLTENVEKMYEHINKTSSVFYEELSKMYKELNERISSGNK